MQKIKIKLLKRTKTEKKLYSKKNCVCVHACYMPIDLEKKIDGHIYIVYLIKVTAPIN